MRDKTTKSSGIRRKIAQALCCTFCIFLVSACGGGSSDSSSSAIKTSSSNTSPTNTGVIALSVEWPDVPYQSAMGARIASSLDCTAANVAEVTVEVYDENGTYLVSGGPWACSARSGTVGNVPAGSNRLVVVIGTDTSGNELYGGEVSGITVIQGQTTNAGIIQTVPIDMTLSDMLADGFNNFIDGNEMLMALDYFYGAKIKMRGSSDNNADIARFFYALAKVASEAYDIESDGVDDGLLDIGDVMDAFGASSSGRLPFFNATGDFADDPGEYYDDPFPDPISPNSPTGADLQNFIYNVPRPVLEAAIASLNLVSPSFNKTWLEPIDGETVESDYGDVLFFKAMFRGYLASIYIQKAYNLNADIYYYDQIDIATEQFLIDNPNFLTLDVAAGTYLSTAKELISSALRNIDDTILWIQNETDAQGDDWVELVGETDADIQEARLDIADAQNSLYGPTLVQDNFVEDPDDPDDDPFYLDLSPLFAGLDFRNPNRLPAFHLDDATGFFPDPTFNGIFGDGIDVNRDIYSYGTCVTSWTGAPCRKGSISSPEPDGTADIINEENEGWWIDCSYCGG